MNFKKLAFFLAENCVPEFKNGVQDIKFVKKMRTVL